MISTSILLVLDGNSSLFYTFDVGLTICLAQVYFGLYIGVISLKHLTSSNIALQTHFLILISFSKAIDFDKETSSLAFDSWIPSNIGILSKFSSIESDFAAVSLNIHKFYTLIILCYSLIYTL